MALEFGIVREEEMEEECGGRMHEGWFGVRRCALWVIWMVGGDQVATWLM